MAKTPVFDADYFIAKFTAIPAKLWMTGAWDDRKGRHCALGHTMKFSKSDGVRSTPESDALCTLFRLNLNWSPVTINDDKYNLYVTGATPRTRVLRALKMIKKAGAK